MVFERWAHLRGRAPQARRERRKLKQRLRDRALTILVGVMCLAVALSMMPGSWQRATQFVACKTLTVGIARCAPADLDLPTLALDTPRCQPIAALLQEFPFAVHDHDTDLGGLTMRRVILADGSSRWLAPIRAIPEPTADAVAYYQGPEGFRVPVSRSWVFPSHTAETPFAHNLFSSVRHSSQLRSIAALPALVGGSPDDPLTRADRVVTTVGTLPPIALPDRAPLPQTEHSGGLRMAAGEAWISLDRREGAPRVAAPLEFVAATDAAGTSPLSGVVEFSDNSDGLGARIQLVVVEPIETGVRLSFIDFTARSDADSEVLDAMVRGQRTRPWPLTSLVPTEPATDRTPSWHQTFLSGATVTRVTLTGNRETSAATITDNLHELRHGFLGARLFDGWRLRSVDVLAPLAEGQRAWHDQSTCRDRDLPRPDTATPRESGSASTRELPGTTMELTVEGCTATEDAAVHRCTFDDRTYDVTLDGRVSPSSDPLLVAQAMIAGRRTGLAPTITVRSQGAVRGPSGPAYRVTYTADTVDRPQAPAVVWVTTMPGGGVGAAQITTAGSLDPADVETILGGLTVRSRP